MTPHSSPLELRRRRSFGLDVVRAVAICMVLLAHGVSLEGIPFAGDLTSGVDLFYVLSGFLIGRIYFSSSIRRDFSVIDFWRARWWRTLPPYFAALGLSWVLAHHPALRPPLEVNASYLTFTQNYTGILGFTPSWSLCVEEHFYLLLPVLAWSLEFLLGRAPFVWILPAAFFVPNLLRAATLYGTGALPTNWFYLTHLHCEGLIAGVWLAYLFVERPAMFAALKKPSLYLLPLAPMLLAILPVWKGRSPDVNIYMFTLYAIGYAAWLRVACDLDWSPRSGAGRAVYRTVSALAICSYSLYLTHTQFFLLRVFLPFDRGIAKTLVVLTLGVAGGVIFYFLFERPAIRTRDWFEGRTRFPRSLPAIGVAVAGMAAADAAAAEVAN